MSLKLFEIILEMVRDGIYREFCVEKRKKGDTGHLIPCFIMILFNTRLEYRGSSNVSTYFIPPWYRDVNYKEGRSNNFHPYNFRRNNLSSQCIM